ncbi:divalent-cation tolerance protein CutA [Aurantiacibacter sp. MUD11]|uniref:divalent-cation tolerance protein CutA n=1 Tax=Aurantiacibacter sp. MUD11 TaxID=3003265 RepID=UPI0022AAEFAD|nr:divalent-cation tolerance protein CutA [Aurantiacibacter sp. MUD11]WAT17162.1 divalent-cation tolerance protein CutA [Aurantiacibacter sp. MUD11]
MSKPGAALIWAPFGSLDEAREVASTMVAEGHVACANIVPQLLSVFRYEGAVQSAEEVGVLFKTEASALERATQRLAQLHPYDTPAILGWRADSAPEETRGWLAEMVTGGGTR